MKYVFLIIVAIALLFPLYWMFLGSLQPIMGLMAMPPRLIPKTINLKNYELIIANHPVLLWVGNTLIIWASVIAFSISATVMAGYAFSLYDFRFKKVIFWIFLAAIMIPRQILIIPMFQVIRILGISGTRIAAIFPLLFWPIGILLFRNFTDTLPRDIIDSARLDGAGELRIIRSIVLPISRPAIGVLVLFKSLEVLGDFLWQMLVLQKAEMKTLLIGILAAVMRRGGDSVMNVNPIGAQLAAGTILFIPLFVIFLFTSKYFVKDVKLGGIKE